MPRLDTIFENKKTGELTINGMKQFVRPFWLTTDAPNEELDLAAVAGNQALAAINVDGEGPVEARTFLLESDRFTAVGDHEALVEISAEGGKKSLMNNPIHANTICGTPGLPLVLPEWLFLHANAPLTFRAQNIFANANSLRFAMGARRMYPLSTADASLNDLVQEMSDRAQWTMLYFMTTSEEIDGLTVAAGATDYFFEVEADAYYEVFRIAAVCYDETLGTMTGTFDFDLFDSPSGRKLHSGPLSNQLAVGTAQLPYICPDSWLIQPKQRVKIEVTNTTPTGNPIDLYFTLLGRKIYV